jgi:hypothetical protein
MTTLPLSNWKRSGEVVAVAVFAVEQQSRSLFKIETNAQGKRKKRRAEAHTHTQRRGGAHLSPFRSSGGGGEENKKRGRRRK